ncbi:MAG TPA: hypothetical protein DFR83_03215 [Deltaproteobacteria bacterium]|nr:hypothetical protein [Deltaproteobacteria bacterium]
MNAAGRRIGGLALCCMIGCGDHSHTLRPMGADREVVLRAAEPDDLVYLVMVDRFENGDPSNDASIDRDDPHGWHGGDVQGVRDRLDHLESIGVKTVWLTPVTAAREEKVGEWGAFHGYWLSDPWAMNPRFGSVAELRALSDDLHARGMRLVVDMVWNHTDYEAEVRTAHPEWFHHEGDIEDWNDPLERVRGDVHGLPDLAQENPAVRAWLHDAAVAWVDRAGLDGLRIDAVGHMPRSFLSYMNERLDSHARKRGNPDGVWTLAEDFTGDPIALAETVEAGGFDAIFDFALHYALLDVACRGADPLRLASTLSLDRYGPPAQSRVTFLDNHDLPRVGSVCGADTPAGLARMDAAFLLLFSLRGTPCLTWGTEAVVLGHEEPANRADLPWTQTDKRSPLLEQLATLRSQHGALHAGTSRIVDASPGHVRIERELDGELAVIDVISSNFKLFDQSRLRTRMHVESVWWARTEGAGERDPAVIHRRLPEAPLVGAGLPELAELQGDGPWTVRVIIGRKASPDERNREVEESGVHRIEVTVHGAPATGELRLVGAHPALGAWNPERSVGPVSPGGNTFRVEMHDGDVPSFKAIVVASDGAVTWSPAADRVVFLRPDLDTSRVEVAWSPAEEATKP